jgi:thiamine biosynthesis lipoprotein
MGTVFSFDVRTPGIDLRPAIDVLHEADRRFSTFRADSEISRVDRGELALDDAHPDVREVLRLGAAAERQGRGAFTLTPNGRLDPSAVVKGWAIERASDALIRQGSRSHLINGGGDIATHGCRADNLPWRVAIAHPWSTDRVVSVVSGDHLAVATSGTAERGGHVVDGRSGAPATTLASITVVGHIGLTAVDIRATTALALGAEGLEWVSQLGDCAAMAVRADGSVTWTAGWSAYAVSGAGAAAA